MAEKSPARRANRILATAALAALLAGTAGALSTGSTVESSPETTIPVDPHGNGHIDGQFLRPADTSLSWFHHSNSVEQFDYEMDELSCDAMRKYISLDLCVVVNGSKSGGFMLVGTEGYWDPENPNSAGIVRVPLDLTVYVLKTDNGPARAMSILDGSFTANYDGEPTEITAYLATTKLGEALVLHKHPQSQTAQSYDFWDEVQVITTSPTGAPTLVASYEGSNIHVSGDGVGILLTSDRYASPKDTKVEPKWSTFTYLRPDESDNSKWLESTSSGASLTLPKSAKLKLTSAYQFPNVDDTRADA